MLELKIRGDKSVSVNRGISMLELKVKGDQSVSVNRGR
jgi:hypothetical protein